MNKKVKQEGPEGPGSLTVHLRKKSKVTVEPIIENPRGIIWTTLVEDLLMMLYIKYESTGSCSFSQEDFWKFHLKTYLLTPWPTYATNWNRLNNFGRGPPSNHSCEVWSKSIKWFQRRCWLKKLLTHGRTHGRWTTDNGPSQKLTLSTLCSGELKIYVIKNFFKYYGRYFHCDTVCVLNNGWSFESITW